MGWIAANGAIDENKFSVYAITDNKAILNTVKNIISNETPIVQKPDTNLLGFTINSKEISTSLCQWFGISPGQEAALVDFPDLSGDELKWIFIRGLFDANGSIRKPF